jgi:RNA polymerase sigma-70 factor (ECF subfamily)
VTESTDDDDTPEAPATPRAAADLRQIHDAHGDFVWRSLQRMGVRDADLADVYQEVFLVIHQRLHTFDGTSHLTTWLFGVCLRVASQYRRRAWVRREQPTDAPDTREDTAPRPDEALDARRRADRLRALLDALDPERRAVFVMFEIDGMTCDEIAAVLGAPLGTVYTRLRAARKDFEQAAARLRARDAWEEQRR